MHIWVGVRGIGSLELELQVVMSLLTLVLATELHKSRKHSDPLSTSLSVVDPGLALNLKSRQG